MSDPTTIHLSIARLRRMPLMAEGSWRDLRLFEEPYSAGSTLLEVKPPRPTGPKHQCTLYPVLENVTTIGELADYAAVELERALGLFITVGPVLKGKREGRLWWSVPEKERRRRGRQPDIEYKIEGDLDESAKEAVWSQRHELVGRPFDWGYM